MGSTPSASIMKIQFDENARVLIKKVSELKSGDFFITEECYRNKDYRHIYMKGEHAYQKKNACIHMNGTVYQMESDYDVIVLNATLTVSPIYENTCDC